MLTRKFLIGALALILLAATAAVATDRTTNNNSDEAMSETVKFLYGSDDLLQQFTHHIDLWHDAVLKGDNDLSRHQAEQLNEMIRRDIKGTEKMVRVLAKQAALEPADEDETDKPDAFSPRRQFERAHALLELKQTLAQSIERTDAFSNKYRLLGDYRDVIRRQLQMPKLKLALKHAETAGSQP